jgi:hypothetical protein
MSTFKEHLLVIHTYLYKDNPKLSFICNIDKDIINLDESEQQRYKEGIHELHKVVREYGSEDRFLTHRQRTNMLKLIDTYTIKYRFEIVTPLKVQNDPPKVQNDPLKVKHKPRKVKIDTLTFPNITKLSDEDDMFTLLVQFIVNLSMNVLDSHVNTFVLDFLECVRPVFFTDTLKYHPIMKEITTQLINCGWIFRNKDGSTSWNYRDDFIGHGFNTQPDRKLLHDNITTIFDFFF